MDSENGECVLNKENTAKGRRRGKENRGLLPLPPSVFLFFLLMLPDTTFLWSSILRLFSDEETEGHEAQDTQPGGERTPVCSGKGFPIQAVFQRESQQLSYSGRRCCSGRGISAILSAVG